LTALLAAPSPPSFWRQEDPIIDEHGHVVMGGMFDHQREWWNLPNFIRGLVTGYGGGKTHTLAKRMVWLSLYNAPVPVMTVSPTYPMAETTIVQTLDEILDGKCTMERRLRYHLFKSQPYRFVLTLGAMSATILCMSGEKPDRLKGSNIAAAGIDEPFMQQRAVFNQVLARIRHPHARRRELNLTGTPEGVVGWGYDLFEGELRAKHDVGLVQRSSRANLALPSDYVQRLESGYDDTAKAAYVDGKFVNLSTGRVYYAFDPTVNITDEPMPEDAELGCGMDFNVDPMAFCVFWRKGERVHYVREFELPNSDSESAAAELLAAYPKCRKVYPDASGAKRSTASPHGRSDFHYLRDAGLTILARPSNPPLRDRYNAVNGALKSRKVTIGPACRKLKSYLMAHTHEDMHKAQQKAMGHLLDAFAYPIAYLMPVDRTRTRLVGFSGA
jgi:hypothetical protein